MYRRIVGSSEGSRGGLQSERPSSQEHASNTPESWVRAPSALPRVACKAGGQSLLPLWPLLLPLCSAGSPHTGLVVVAPPNNPISGL